VQTAVQFRHALPARDKAERIGSHPMPNFLDSYEEVMLTPEMAAKFLANPHPKQRRVSKQVVDKICRTILSGRWVRVHDAILVAPAPDGRMFNGGHRCSAVIETGIAIPVVVDWGADPNLFDVIDIGLARKTHQFIKQDDAYVRSSAARLCLWYDQRFSRQPVGTNVWFDLSELLDEAGQRETAFDTYIPLARKMYDLTGISKSVALAAFTLAADLGFDREVYEYVAGVEDFSGLQPDDPRRAIAERFRRQEHRNRRRQTVGDWTMLVRSLNQHIEGVSIKTLYMTNLWPFVGEQEEAFRRRRSAVQEQMRRARKMPDTVAV